MFFICFGLCNYLIDCFPAKYTHYVNLYVYISESESIQANMNTVQNPLQQIN